MKRKKLIKIAMTIALATLVTGFTVGCSGNENGEALNNSNSISENDNEKNVVSQDVESVDTEKTTDEEVIAPKVQSEEFSLYSKDVNTDEEIILGVVSINETKTVEEKLQVLAGQLSKDAFTGLPIEFVEITEIEGKKVATFNLKEVGKNIEETDYSKYDGESWFNNYFQGSTGGTITTYTLNKTLLQKEYSGEWVDGVKYLYKGQPIAFEHVESLGSINYR